MDNFMMEEHRRRQAIVGAKQIIAEALKKAREAKKELNYGKDKDNVVE